MTAWRDGVAVQAWLADHPEQEPWVAAQNRIWEVVLEYHAAGYTASQASAHLALTDEPQPADDVTELKEQLQRQHDAIERQANTITQLQERAKHIDFSDLPDKQQRELYDRARKRLRRINRRQERGLR